LLLSRYGREAELDSDEYGMKYMSRAGYDPQGAVELQQTFVRLSEGRQQDWLNGLFASHPPSQQRVATNRATAATLPAGGRIGKAEYAAAIKKTRALKPAYEAYDEGRAALSENKLDEALAYAEKALDVFPGEANFHALRGDVRLKQKNLDWAVTNYTRAIELRDDFFYYHLQRGLAREKLGQIDAAEADLKRSLQYLPTAPAHYILGNIAKSRGDLNTAMQHYRVVAESGGAYGEAATAAMVKIELPTNPSAYVLRRCDADAAGNLVVSVKNNTGVAIEGIQIAISYTDSAGRPQRVVQSVRGQLPPAGVTALNTGMGPYNGGDCPVEVVAAQIVE
jgi:predicted Zn-dependent protease